MLKLLPEWLKIGCAALIGGITVFVVYSTLNTVWWLPAAKQEARTLEAAEATAATNKAIGELSNAADQARVRRRLCAERSGMFDYAKSECREAKPVQHD